MPLLLPRRLHRSTHRAMAMVIALSLLSMPVTYRGGAAEAHAHTIFQLWEDVRLGSFTHHGAAGSAPTEAGGTEGAATGHSMAAGSGSGMDFGAPGHDASTGTGGLVDQGTLAAPRSGVAAEGRDAPRVGTAFTPADQGTVLVLPTDASILWPGSFSPAARRPTRLQGIAEPPTAPPPRRPG